VRDEIESFVRQGVQPLGVNPASVERHTRYAEKMGFPFPLLSDPDGAIAGAYGALKPLLRSIQRSVVGIGRDGRVAYAVRGAPPVAEILAAFPA
jgi:peroxiredoxin Q/BCP